jgi:ferritin-like metal-binding protein YciE
MKWPDMDQCEHMQSYWVTRKLSDLLQETLDEEKAASQTLTKISKTVNNQAQRAA